MTTDNVAILHSKGSQDMNIISNVFGASLSPENQASNALKFKRCLEVLETYMDLFDTKYSHSPIVRRHSTLDETGMVTVKVTSFLSTVNV